MTEIDYPLKLDIIKLCEDLIDRNFKQKGNSWTNAYVTPKPFLEHKLQEEYKEFVRALLEENERDIAKEGADLINVIAMCINRYGAILAKADPDQV